MINSGNSKKFSITEMHGKRHHKARAYLEVEEAGQGCMVEGVYAMLVIQ